jgi:hypothetical protein
MSEYPRTIPDLEGATWCDGLGAPSVVEPDAGLKAVGYAAADKPAHTAWNWIFQLIGYTMDWLRGCVVRRFGMLSEALTATTEGDIFQVHSPNIAPTKQRGDLLGWLTLGTADTVTAICTDGLRVFVIFAVDAATNLRAYSAYTGALLWTAAAPNPAQPPQAVCCDGAYVFMASREADNSNSSLVMFDAATGEVLDVFGLTGTDIIEPYGLASNGGGQVFAIGYGTTKTWTRAWTHNGDELTDDWTVNHGTVVTSARLHGITCVRSLVAVTGYKSAADDMFIRVYDKDGTELATVEASGTPALVGQRLGTDGDHLVVASNASDPDATYESSVRVYSLPWNSAPMQMLRRNGGTPGTLDVDQMSVDGKYILYADSAGDTNLARIDDLCLVWSDSESYDVSPSALDGVCAWMIPSGNDVRMYKMHDEGEVLRRAAVENDRPIPGRLAQPVRY